MPSRRADHGTVYHKMDHLACFVSGMLVLGADGPGADRLLQLGREIGETCYQARARCSAE